MKNPPHIAIVGGGFGGLETALYLRRSLGERARITLLSEKAFFTFRPNLVYMPFGFDPEQARLDLGKLAASHQIDFRAERVEGIDPARKQVALASGPLSYDYLVLATGASPAPSEVPGLDNAAHTIWRESDLMHLRAAFERLRYADYAQPRRVVFLVPPGSQWAGPLYEMSFMLAQWLDWGDARSSSSIRFLTHEQQYMETLGSEIHDLLDNEFEHYHIEAEANRHVVQIDGQTLICEHGQPIPFDLLIAAPTYQPSVSWHPLPSDARGFLHAVDGTRQVEGWEDIYAVGDTSDYPIKQAFLALLQADAAAEHIASRVLGTQPAFSFEPSSLWVMDQFGQALFAHTPLDAEEDLGAPGYVQMIPPGLLQRVALRDHLPMQSQLGNPLYAGLLWKGMRTGMGLLKYLLQPQA